MPQWIPIAKVADCPPGSSLECVAGENLLAVFNVDGNVYAIDGVCPHQGGPLSKGKLTGCIVSCPWHGWQFDVRDGRHQLNVRLAQPRFSVRVENEVILVELP